MLDTVFMKVLDMTAQGSIVILAVLLARLLLKKSPKLFSYLLWAVVLFRLLCPVSVQVPVSVMPEIEPVDSWYTLEDEPLTVKDASVAAYQAVGDAVNGGLGVQYIGTDVQETDGTRYVVTANWWEVWVLFGQYVWLAGVGAMLLYSVISCIRLRRSLVGAMRQEKNIYLADHIDSPFVLGLFRPKIYLPSALEAREQSYILAHEQHHIRRLDHVFKLLAFAALTLHWFNPLVWMAFRLFTRDMEMSCDEAVIRKLGADIRADYSASLLKLTAGRHRLGITPLAFGEEDTKGRIKNMSRWKKPKVWICIIAVVILLTAAVVLVTNPIGSRETVTGLLGANYTAEHVLYDTTTEYTHYDRVCITADYRLYLWEPATDNVWYNEGQLEPYPLTEKELKQYTARESGWQEDYRIGRIEEAYICRVENDYFYLAIQMKNGDTLLGLGWEDVSERNDPYSDDTDLRWLYLLKSEFTGGDTNFANNDEVIDYLCWSMTEVAGAVDCIQVNVMHENPGYAVAGFQGNYYDGAYHDMGFAVFRTDGTGYRLLDYHFYDNAANEKNGIYFCAHPAVLAEDGISTDSNTFDVLLSCNPELDKVIRIYQANGERVMEVTHQQTDSSAMMLNRWDECREATEMFQYYLDQDGNELLDMEKTGVGADRIDENAEMSYSAQYGRIIEDYRKIVAFRLSDAYTQEQIDRRHVGWSTTLQQAIDKGNASSSNWSYMIQELPNSPEAENAGYYGYILYDLNADGVPELFWVRKDHSILAIFTYREGQAVLFDAYWSRYPAFMTQEGSLLTLSSGGAAYNTHYIVELTSSGDRRLPYGFASIPLEDSGETVFYEISNGVQTKISRERYEALCTQYPLKQSDLWKDQPIEELP